MTMALRDATRVPGSIPASAGIGLRAQHQSELQNSRPAVGWLEAHSENYFSDAGPHIEALLRLRGQYALSLHGVGLSLGSIDPIDISHLMRLKRLIGRTSPAFVSEHLSWGGVDGRFVNDLLPLPYTQESLAHLISRVNQVQNTLQCAILIENISSYLQYSHSDIDEGAFLTELSRATGCGLLIDINNLYVNERNHGVDARRFIDSIPPAAVRELHLAGHSIDRVDATEILIDTHSTQVCEAVWSLYGHAIQRFGARPTLIEWDSDIPPLDVLLGEAHKAQSYLGAAHDLAA
jgi:uncharacterized protein (UPF0276 family)